MHSDDDPEREDLRDKIIGLGRLSIRKSYYPEFKQHEEALRESEARLRSILHASPVMQFVIDRDHRVISWNRAIETYSGIPEGDILGTDDQWRPFYREKRPVLADIVLDGDFDRLPVLFGDTVRKSPIIVNGYEASCFLQEPGSGGRWLHATAVPIQDAKGAVIGAIETIEDITEQKEAEIALSRQKDELRRANEELVATEKVLREQFEILASAERQVRESEKFLGSIVDNIPSMIFIKDARDLRFVRLNRAGEVLLGLSRENLLGKTDGDFFPEKEAEVFTRQDRAVLETGRPLEIPEEKIHTRVQGERILHTRKIAITDESGKPAYLMGISDDITERKRMENTLQLARSKINLLNTVTFQDIQNAAFAISAYHELLRRLITDPMTVKYLEKQESLTRKITDTLNFAKNYQEMGSSPPRWQNVGRVFLLAISHLDFLRIQRTEQIEGLEIYADPLLEKVFLNLMQNVLVHGDHASEVTIRYQETPSGLVLLIEDNGGGIPAEEKHMIFDRGYGKNAGLGLFLVREVLSITGMSIRETGEPGRGARFEIQVPKEGYRFRKGRSMES